MKQLKLTKSYVIRVLTMLVCIPAMSFGCALMVLAELGSDPYTSMQIGISTATNIEVGNISLMCNVFILVAFIFIDRTLISLATVAFAALFGPTLSVWNYLIAQFITVDQMSYAARVGAVCLGTVIMIITLAIYQPTQTGIQSLDMLATWVGRLFHSTYGLGLTVTYATMLAIAIFIFHAPWGVGTVIATLCVGKGVDLCSPFIKPRVLKWCLMEPEQADQAAPQAPCAE